MKAKSFSLVEIVTVVSIILVITASVAASFFIAGSKRLEAEAREILYDIAWLREAAAATRNNYYIHFSSRYYEVYRQGGSLLKRKNLVARISSPSPPFDLYFYSFSSGNSPWAAGDSDSLTVQLSHQGKTKSITVFGKTGLGVLHD